ncbi:MAG: DUF4168 domain-containing protein [Rhodobacterales bacterium]
MTLKTNRSLKAFFLSASVAALSLGTVAPLAAQTAAPAPQASEVEMSDAKLEAFVTALLGVEEVRVDYTPQIEAAGTEEEQAELVNQANAEIIEKIDAVPDLTVDEYVTIAQVAQQDQELGARIAMMVEAQTN